MSTLPVIQPDAMMTDQTLHTVLQALSTVIEPKSGRDIVRLNWIRGLTVRGKHIGFTIMADGTTRAFSADVASLCQTAITDALGAQVTVNAQVDHEMIPLGNDLMMDGGGGHKALTLEAHNTIAVASGKGGVGKSTVAVNLAVALAQQGYEVGLVDTDMYGPSIPTMFDVEGAKPKVNADRKIIPIEKYGVKLLSMGFLVDPDKAVIWRGPMVSSAVKQFLGETQWGDLDYLILDLPPGTGDIQLTIVQTVALTGAIIVSTPQKVALADARKGVAMFEQVQVPVLGIIENMAYFTPPELPEKKYYLFGEKGAYQLSQEMDVPFLGELPIESQIRESGDEGHPYVASHAKSSSATVISNLAKDVVAQIRLRNATAPPTQKIEILHR